VQQFADRHEEVPLTSPHPIPDRMALGRVVERLSRGLVDREGQARCLLLATLCGEHVLLVGPPGTAKSELARRLQQVVGGRWFERLLTRFTVPEELFGPLSLAALDEGRYQREVDGYLPTASVAFLDEVFKANSAILNALLTLLNERSFDQGPDRLQVPLLTLVGATNELPADEGLAAFLDRFLFRCAVHPVGDDGFRALLGADADADAGTRSALHVQAPYLDAAVLASIGSASAAVALRSDVIEALSELRVMLREAGVGVSDRRWVRSVAVLRVAAFTHGRSAVAVADLWVLRWVLVHDEASVAQFDAWFAKRLGGERALVPERLARLAQAWEAQIEIEEAATELAYDDSGKLALARALGGVDDDSARASAPRMSAFSRRRQFSRSHVAARLAQLDALLAEVDAWHESLQSHRDGVIAQLDEHLWIDPAFGQTVSAHLAASAEAMVAVRLSLARSRQAFAALPLTDVDDGSQPEPLRA
jgi:MoxR-like ATPase